MDKVFTFLMITVMISFFFWALGYGTDLNSVGMISNIITGDFTNNPLWVEILAILALATGVFAVGALLTGNSSAAITSASIAMTGFLVSYIQDMVHVLNIAKINCSIYTGGLCAITYWILAGIMIPLMIGFAWSLIQFAFGGDD